MSNTAILDSSDLFVAMAGLLLFLPCHLEGALNCLDLVNHITHEKKVTHNG